MSVIRIGLSSWLDKSLLESGLFYPPEINDADGRLRYYASQFPQLVEVNSTYYSLPSERNAIYWDKRTPDDFIFDIKIYSLFTQHPTEARSLPRDILQQLSQEAQAKSRIYLNDVPPELTEEIIARYVSALRPLHERGKLGAILLQFPRWFYPRRDSFAQIEWLKEHLGDYQAAVEFRNSRWLDDRHRDSTLGFLRDHGLAYVCVDEPQGHPSSVPPLAEVTSPELSYVRFHGRRAETWEKEGVTVQERTKYIYSPAELQEWVPKIEHLTDEAQEVHILMNTNYEDHAVRNARQLKLLLDQAHT